jgi:cyclase
MWVPCETSTDFVMFPPGRIGKDSPHTLTLLSFLSLFRQTFSMKMGLLLIILFGALFTPVIALPCRGSQESAQERPLYNPKLPDFTKIEITTTKVGPNIYMLQGGPGSTVGVLTGPEGILVVDTQYPQLTEKIVAAIRKISNAPVRFVVNTHVHPDHMGGNEAFAKMGAVIFARDELRTRLMHGLADAAGYRLPAPHGALPVVTYSGPTSIHIDGEDVELIPIPRAHTDGDTVVLFPAADVLMTSDIFRVTNGYPGADANNGGSVKGIIDGLGVAISLSGPNTKVIPGHGEFSDRAGLIAQRDMIVYVWREVASMIQAGKSENEIVTAHPTAPYDAKVDRGPDTADRFVRQIYSEIKASAPN